MNQHEFLDWLMEAVLEAKQTGKLQFNCGGGRKIVGGVTQELSLCTDGETIFNIKAELITKED